MKRIFYIFLFIAPLLQMVSGQPNRWQQRVRYAMDIDMDVHTNQFAGKQRLEYWNNSPIR
jgi:hypothetical protein